MYLMFKLTGNKKQPHRCRKSLKFLLEKFDQVRQIHCAIFVLRIKDEEKEREKIIITKYLFKSTKYLFKY